jgi:hypothetical protein
MSYRAFTKDLSDEHSVLRSQTSALSAADFKRAYRRVFDRWLAADRYEELIGYLIENYDGRVGGEQWLRRLGQELGKIDRPELIHKLYRPMIERRRKVGDFSGQNR